MSRYAILRQLGHGNLTRIFLAAVQAPLGPELCVLKLIHAELGHDDDFRALFLDQTATTLALAHPNLARTLDVIVDADACGSSLEFLEGQTLASLIERLGRMRFPVDIHLHVLSRVLGAIDYIHRFGAGGPGRAHGDICPNNVFITYDGQIKLLGAGYAEAMRVLEGKLGRPLVDVRYAAPEVLLGHPAGPSADLFGIGTMVWEAMARQARVSSEDTATIVGRRTQGDEPVLERVWLDAPLPAIELCQRALAMDPLQRYASALELRRDLDTLLGRATESSEAVLSRLPRLMQTLFEPEREQMRQFIASSLRNLREQPVPAPERPLDTEGEESTSPAGASPQVATTPVPARPSRVARPTRVVPLAALSIATPPSVEERPSSHGLAALQTPGGAGARVRRNRTRAPRAEVLDVAAPRDSSSGGHRAYSTNLDHTRRARKFLLSPDVWGAAALLVGSVVAGYSLHRHSSLDKRADGELAEAPPAAAANLSPSAQDAPVAPRSTPGASDPDAPPRPTPRAVDAGGGGDEGERSTPAFFDGKAIVELQNPSVPIEADDLPPINPELSSLQDAILNGARAHRLALKHRREKRGDAPLGDPAVTSPRAIDESDPFAAPRTE